MRPQLAASAVPSMAMGFAKALDDKPEQRKTVRTSEKILHAVMSTLPSRDFRSAPPGRPKGRDHC